MADKYTKEDVIIWPDDPRLKEVMNKKCYAANKPIETLSLANKKDTYEYEFVGIRKNSSRPFKLRIFRTICYFPVIIIKKED